MSKDIIFKPIVGAIQLEAIKSNYIELFQAVFQKKYPSGFWEHFFNDNPVGVSRAVAGFYEGKLVAFCALIDQELTDNSTKKNFLYGLLFSVIVSPEHRSMGFTYIAMMRQAKELARLSGHEFILVFPNEAAFLPVTRLAKFSLLDEGMFVRGKLGQSEYLEFLKRQTGNVFFSERLWHWRKNRFPYSIANGLVVKCFNEEDNLMDILGEPIQNTLPSVFPYWKSAGPCPYPAVDQYIFRICYYLLNEKFNIQRIKRSIMFSDIY